MHQLRPGDIDIVAAIGDSLTAGNGGLATNIIQVATENKGLSWTIGGQKTWREFLTIPNILKEYNPRLYGYSVTDGLDTHRSSKFNVAEIGAMSRDTPHQARNLVLRMKNDPNVDMQNHWKVGHKSLTFIIVCLSVDIIFDVVMQFRSVIDDGPWK